MVEFIPTLLECSCKGIEKYYTIERSLIYEEKMLHQFGVVYRKIPFKNHELPNNYSSQ